MKKISLIGCGRWGTFLGWYAGNYCGFDQVDMYDIPTSPNFIELRDTRKNPYLSLSDNMILHDKIEDVLKNDIVIVSIGCQHFRSLCRQLNGFDVRGRTFLLAMKGLETPSAAIMHDIMKEEIQQNIHIAVLAGPGHVQDYMKKVPSCAVIDSYEEETKDMLIKNLQSELIRFYYGSDLIGNQIGAALKNVIALCAGVCDGMGFGDNTKAALMTRGLTEIARLGVALGGRRETFAGLSGVGDLIVTCTSMHSRNRRCGILIGKGTPTAQAIQEIGAVVEGYYAAATARALAQKTGVEMPITEAAYQVLYHDKDPRAVIVELMTRERKHELEDSWV